MCNRQSDASQLGGQNCSHLILSGKQEAKGRKPRREGRRFYVEMGFVFS
jgi:hypothetical protein